jgi:hypothetical protein
MRPVNTSATPDLFEVSELDNELLDDNKEFLSTVMTLMYLARLTRPDILLPVTYLASRAHTPTAGDLKKLKRVIKYLSGTVNDGITIQCRDLQMHCHCDESYGVHSDGRSQTGFVFSYGYNYSFLHALGSRRSDGYCYIVDRDMRCNTMEPSSSLAI